MTSRFSPIISRYDSVRSVRDDRAKQFLSGSRPYMIFQTPPARIWSDIRSSEDCFAANLDNIEASLAIPSDHLPVLEPWFGTGVYAHIFGCPYVWMQGEAPAVRYRYTALDDIRGLTKPSWQHSDIAGLVLETIRYFKARSGDALPIVWTDTQSASDTATLILDATEVFVACLEEPETILAFMQMINDVVIEFSQVQAELIGPALLKPGHIMLSGTGFRGMSISDDNLAVASPAINERFNLALDEALGRAMGGVAIHSCGNWAHSMPLVPLTVPSCVAIDCAVDKDCGEPSPNDPEKVRDAFAGTGIHVHARMTGRTDQMLDTVRRLYHPDLKLIVHPAFIDQAAADRNYAELDSLLDSLNSR